MNHESCFICRKHRGLEAAPPGGYIYEDAHWRICHAPPNLGPLGTLFIESKRHFLDYAEMSAEEAASVGVILQRIFHALREHTHAERVYQLMTMEGQPHFHSWLVPRRREILERGLKFLGRDDSCNARDAIALVEKLCESMR